MPSSSSSKMLELKSSDGDLFQVVETLALQSETIKHLIEDDCVSHCANTTITLHKVTRKILVKVLEYCKKHVEAPNSEDKVAEEDLKAFDADFVKVDLGTLFGLILAANDLKITSLLDLTCQTVANMIRGKTHDEMLKMFNIKKDFTAEEVEARRKYAWAFQSLLQQD